MKSGLLIQRLRAQADRSQPGGYCYGDPATLYAAADRLVALEAALDQIDAKALFESPSRIRRIASAALEETS